MKRLIITLLVALISLTTNLPGLIRPHLALAQRAGRSITIPTDTVFRLKLSHGLSSRTAQKGDTFTARVISPVVVGDHVAVPVGSTVYGRMTAVTKAARRQNGTIAVTFYKLGLPSGEVHQIYGSLTSLENEKGDQQGAGREGEVKGKSTTKRDVIFIGGGAGTGAAIGAAAGGGKGAGIGAAIGAGVGVAGALLSKGHEAEISSGTEILMALDREVTVAGNANRY